MKKMRVDLGALEVESFATEGRGSVRAHDYDGNGDPFEATGGQVRPGTCDSANNCTIYSTACTGWCCQASYDGVLPCGGGQTYTTPGGYTCPP